MHVRSRSWDNKISRTEFSRFAACMGALQESHLRVVPLVPDPTK